MQLAIVLSSVINSILAMTYFFKYTLSILVGISAIALNIPTIAAPIQAPRAEASPQVRILLSRGQSLYELGRYTEALSATNRILTIQPNHIEALELRGNILQKLARYQDALQSYDQALSLLGDEAENPEQDEIITTLWTERARVLAHLERYEESVSSYDTALQRRCAQRIAAKEPIPDVCQGYTQPIANPQPTSPPLW
jgi:tetratricopeptide (TPR) repeat protein